MKATPMVTAARKALPTFAPTDANGAAAPDGSYNYKIEILPALSPEAQAALEAAQDSHDPAVIAQLQASGLLPTVPLTQFGSFGVSGGAIVEDALEQGQAQTVAKEEGAQTLSQSADDKLVQPQAAVVADDQSFRSR